MAKDTYYRRLLLAGSDPTEAELSAMEAKYGKACLSCGSLDNLCLDHIVPLSKHGKNTISNRQWLCRTCNGHKSARTIDYRIPHP